MSPAASTPSSIRRGLLVAIAVAALWVAVSGITWWLPHEDGLRHFGVWCLLLLTAPGIVLMSVSRRAALLGLLAAFVTLFAVWVLPTPVGVALTAGLLGLTTALRHDLDVGDWPYVGRVLGCVWLTLYVVLTPWPFHLWPWSTIRADIAARLTESAYTVPPRETLPIPQRLDVRGLMHPLFRSPIYISLQKDGPVGQGAVVATMYYGDGRLARIDTRDPLCFLNVGD